MCPAFLTQKLRVRHDTALPPRLAPVGVPLAAGFSIAKNDTGNFIVTDVTSNAAAIRRMNAGDMLVSLGNHVFEPGDSLEHAAQLFDELPSLPVELVVMRVMGRSGSMRFIVRIQQGDKAFAQSSMKSLAGNLAHVQDAQNFDDSTSRQNAPIILPDVSPYVDAETVHGVAGNASPLSSNRSNPSFHTQMSAAGEEAVTSAQSLRSVFSDVTSCTSLELTDDELNDGTRGKGHWSGTAIYHHEKPQRVRAPLQPFRSNDAQLLPFTLSFQQKRQSSSSIASSQANSETFGDEMSANSESDVERDDSEDTDEVGAPRHADSASALPVESSDEDNGGQEISRQQVRADTVWRKFLSSKYGETRAAASASAHGIREHAAEHRAKFDFGAAFRRTTSIETKLENQDMSLKNMMFPKRARAASNAAPGVGSSERPALMHAKTRGEGVQYVDDTRDVAADVPAEKAVSSSWVRATDYRNSFDAKAAFTEKQSRLDLSRLQQKSLSLKALLFG
jgi:hypothetical protein